MLHVAAFLQVIMWMHYHMLFCFQCCNNDSSN